MDAPSNAGAAILAFIAAQFVDFFTYPLSSCHKHAILGPMLFGRMTQSRAFQECNLGMKHSPSDAVSPVGEDVRTQFGAICWRKAGRGIDVLMITSRETGRWVIPKGWPVKGLDGSGSAEREAWEEAGVAGKISKNCLGVFSYQKVLDQNQCVPCIVAIYGLQVEKLSRRYPEQSQRQRKWFSVAEAALLVAEPELSALLIALGDGKLQLDMMSSGKKGSSAGK